MRAAQRAMGGVPIAPEGLAARVIAAFLGTAGIFYVNVMPALIDALKVSAGFTNLQAGIIGAANTYGGALGAVTVALLVRRVRWYPLTNLLLPALIAMDLLSMQLHGAVWLALARFLHGIFGGATVGVGFLVISRIARPNRTFGILILLQAGIAAAGIAVLPLLVRRYGIVALWGAMVSFSLLTWALIQLLPRDRAGAKTQPLATAAADGGASRASGVRVLPLLAVALFQAGNMALYAFEVSLGQSFGHDIRFISSSLGLAGIAGVAGPALLTVLPPRFGYRVPLGIAMFATLGGIGWLLLGGHREAWLLANTIWGVAWNFCLPMLFGLNTFLDPSGSASVWSGFMSKTGLACGPLIGALVLGADRYAALIGVSLLFVSCSLMAVIGPATQADRQLRGSAAERSFQN